MSETTSIKLRDGLKDRVKMLAEDENRSPNWLMNDAISEYVERKEAKKALLAELRAAHQEYVDSGGLHLTHDEVKDWMARRARGERAPMPKLHK